MSHLEPPLATNSLASRQARVRTMLGFCVLLLMLAGSWMVFKYVRRQPTVSGAPATLHSVLSANERLFSGLFSSNRGAREFPVSKAVKNARVNGKIGVRDTVDAALWRLQVVRNSGDTLNISLDEIRALPKKDIVFDFKCIEGWSQVTHWAGVPFKTFLEHYGLKAEEARRYIGLQTPDGAYYVGIDMPSALHPQTLLCYEMNGKPLPQDQGFPLRLIIPVKYGIKHLKRIGTLFFSQQKPRDYWAERGYDYYSGH
jgi:DMSO/TMAO reductase YedYZ molybdopterin-dependent catalytic subunit